jgi:putative DNA primase/helicase
MRSQEGAHVSFDPSNFNRLLTTLGRGEDAAVRIGWATHEADFSSKLVVRDVLPSFIDGLLQQKANIYFEINPSSHEGKGRTAANEVTQLVALWADIDFKNGGMKTPEAATELIQSLSTVLGDEPAAIVHSGGGVQPYWLLDEVINIKYGDDRPVGVAFTEAPRMWSLEEVTDILDDWGVVEPDTGLSDTVISPESDWNWAETDCHFVGTAREEIGSSEPVARHQWMLKWSALLYGMIRNGCITEASFYELRDLLVERFRWICQHSGTPREPGARELDDAFTYGLRRAQLWDQDKLNDELRHHVHRDFDEQFAFMLEREIEQVHAPAMAKALDAVVYAEAPASHGAGESGGGGVETGTPAAATAPEVPAPAPLDLLASLKPKNMVDRMKVAPRTDTGNAERLARKFTGEFIFVPDIGWMRFDGARYVRDQGAQHIERAKDVFMALFTSGNTADQKWALKSLGAGALSAAIRLAQSTSEMVRAPFMLDAEPYELCTPAGIVDLRTGKLRPADPVRDLNTQITGAAPDWSKPPKRFLELLAWMQPERAMQEYLQRIAGIALIGNVEYQIFPIFVGSGGNGKGVLMELWSLAMGDYAAVMPREFLVEKANSDHPTEIAQLLGKRLAINNEVKPSARFNEDFLKALVGDRVLRARFMRGDFIDIPNRALQVMTANHLPSVPAGGYGFWRRVRKINSDAKIEPGKENPSLVAEVFAAEGPQILAWMIDGAREVIANGEQVPQSVLVATDEYKFEEDAIARFISTRMSPMPGMAASRDSTYAIYRQWALGEGINPLQRQKFEREVLAQLPEARSIDPEREHLFEGYIVASSIMEIPVVPGG